MGTIATTLQAPLLPVPDAAQTTQPFWHIILPKPTNPTIPHWTNGEANSKYEVHANVFNFILNNRAEDISRQLDVDL